MQLLGAEGWLFAPADPVSIAEAMGRAFDDEAECQRMVVQSRRAMDAYTWDDVAVGYLAVLEAAVRSSV